MRQRILVAGVAMIAGCHTGAPSPVTGRAVPESRYLFVWAGDSNKQESDFLAVIDVDRRSSTYAQVIATLPVGATATMPHHTEYQMPATLIRESTTVFREFVIGEAAFRLFELEILVLGRH